MRSLILSYALACCVAVAAQSDSPDQGILVTPGWLADHLQDPSVVVLHVANLRDDYDREHIPGARFLWPTWIAESTPEGSFQVPDAKKIEKTFENLGVSDRSQVVLCQVLGDVATTARVYVTLDYIGMGDRTVILNGGLEAWKAEGRPLTSEVPKYRKGSLKLRLKPEVFADLDAVAATHRSEGVRVVDARSAGGYNASGGTGVVRGGHIPGAVNIPYSSVVDKTNQYLPIDSLKVRFDAAGVKPGDAVITYCNVGRAASPVYVAARLLGYDVRLYDGSFEEWSRRLDLPVESTAAK